MVVLRHAEAESRKRFEGPDDKRPLAKDGRREARRLVPCLAAYAPVRAVASEAVRCAATLRPYARSAGITVERGERLRRGGRRPRGCTCPPAGAVAPGDSLVVCTHRPLLPALSSSSGWTLSTATGGVHRGSSAARTAPSPRSNGTGSSRSLVHPPSAVSTGRGGQVAANRSRCVHQGRQVTSPGLPTFVTKRSSTR